MARTQSRDSPTTATAAAATTTTTAAARTTLGSRISNTLGLTQNKIHHRVLQGNWTSILRRLQTPEGKKLARKPNPCGDLPLHLACYGGQTPPVVVRALIAAHPAGVFHRNQRGFVPLQLARTNYRTDHPFRRDVIGFLEAYSVRDSNDNSSSSNDNDSNNSRNRNASNPWVNPQSIQDELIAARRDLANAWEDLRSIKHSSGEDHCDESSNPNNDNDNSNSNNDDDEDKDHLPDDEFIALYVDTITDAFGDVLGQMQDNGENNSNSSSSSNNNNNNIDVELLVDCLQSGIDLLDPDQRNRKSYFASLGHNENETETVHEARQRSLGYLPVVS